MKIRTALVFLASAALIAAGCGSDGGDSKKKDDDKGSDKKGGEQSVVEAKEENVAESKEAFEKDSKDPNLCRSLALSYVALASPESTGDPKKAAEPPKDKEENLGKAIDTLQKCIELDSDDRSIRSLLASTYMATGQFEEASPILKGLAATAEGGERSNAYYAWGLAASNSQDNAEAIEAWTKFIEVTPADDPRVAQVKQSVATLRSAPAAPAAEPAADAEEDGGGDDEGDGDDGDGDGEDGGS